MYNPQPKEHITMRSVMPDATSSDISADLADLANATSNPTELPPITEFFDADRDWVEVEAARRWWPKQGSLPDPFTWPVAIGAAIRGYSHPNPAMRTTSLLAELSARAQVAATQLVARGGDAKHPNETKAERMRRLNRERVARWRAEHREGSTTAELGTLTPAGLAWAEVNDLRRQRREAEADLDEAVRYHQQAMVAASKNRQKILAEWDQRIDAAKVAHHQTKNS